MPTGRLSDLVLPESFSTDVYNTSVESSALFASGVVQDITAQLPVAPSSGALNMPFWNDLAGNSQLAHSGVDLTTGKIDQGKDIATVLSRAAVFGAHDLSAAMKGEDPIGVIASLFGAYWGREFDRITVQNVIAAMATTVSGGSMAANVLNIGALSGAAAYVDASSMIDAAGLLGDFESRLTAVAMHSAVERNLRKQGLIDTELDENRLPIRTYQGKALIVSDRLTASSSVYPIIFFGEGAVGYAEGQPKVSEEVHRDPKINGGEEALIQRKLFTLHPRGIAFTGDPAGETATDAELANAANWTRKWSSKNIRLVVHRAKLDPAL
jgi:hypothetical protein